MNVIRDVKTSGVVGGALVTSEAQGVTAFGGLPNHARNPKRKTSTAQIHHFGSQAQIQGI